MILLYVLLIYLYIFSSYVSCSECSYDSDNCTCNSADRCYCSLGAVDINAKLNKAEEEQHRRSPSCNSDDKCYCSMGETVNDGGSTTWCDDSDSCASASKCYCSLHDRKFNHHRKQQLNGKNNAGGGGEKRNSTNTITTTATTVATTTNNNNKSKSNRSRKADNLALDYELFTVSGSQQRQHVKPTEALSVKKSVEMAAVFADVKLSQTTDITSLQASNEAGGNGLKSHKLKHHHKKHNNNNNNNINSGGGKNVVEINNSKNINLNPKSDDYYKVNEVILRKDVDLNNKRATNNHKNEGYYQPVGPQRPVSNSLEDSLGYLP